MKRKYKLYKFDKMIYKNWISVLPTIDIIRNDTIYVRYNFSIRLSFLCFHFRWLFMEVEE